MPRFTRVLAILPVACFVIAVGVAHPQDEKVVPAKFKREGGFSGGSSLSDAVLSGIRFGKHSDFLRVVFDLHQIVNGKRIGAPKHPPYSVEYRRFPYRFLIKLEGVKYADDAQVQVENALPLTIVTTPDNEIKLIEIFVNEPSAFKVIEIDDPAKISLDIKKVEEEIPQVYAVQLKDVDDVEGAFDLMESGKLPKGINADILVIGNAVFVEAVFLSLEEAAEAASLLEENGFVTLISERRGNELPHL